MIGMVTMVMGSVASKNAPIRNEINAIMRNIALSLISGFLDLKASIPIKRPI